MSARTLYRGRRELPVRQTQGSVSTDIADQRPPLDPPRRPRGYELRAAEQERAQIAAMSILSQISAHLGEVLTLAKAVAAGDVLVQTTAVISAAGTYCLTWPVAFSAVTLANLGTGGLTATTGPPNPSGTAPSLGAGVFAVGAGVQRTVPCRGNALTVYGAPGAVFELIVYARPRQPHSGPAASVTAGASPSSAANVPVVATGLAPITSLANASAVSAGTALDGGVCHSNASLIVISSAGVSAGAVQLQGSNDGVNWANLGAAVSTTTASTVFPPVNVQCAIRFVRAAITTIITGGTITAEVGVSG